MSDSEQKLLVRVHQLDSGKPEQWVLVLQAELAQVKGAFVELPKARAHLEMVEAALRFFVDIYHYFGMVLAQWFRTRWPFSIVFLRHSRMSRSEAKLRSAPYSHGRNTRVWKAVSPSMEPRATQSSSWETSPSATGEESWHSSPKGLFDTTAARGRSASYS
ncbi:hypothetical protein AXF42_Ash000577 [Apostasia shenzhenica]|uniref:Uncharacterized protein n=1 Tax=Apostasia shenzhenica TaxID=1088818 RepID=A0A2I0AGR9_9ASPA|nr:hypothetical protein AXF42_Ash000577 [Apostasia shenzhenica]